MLLRLRLRPRVHMDIDITLNGEPHRVADGSDVARLVMALNQPGRGIAVAINREIVPRATWPVRRLIPGDRVDIVKAIGGG